MEERTYSNKEMLQSSPVYVQEDVAPENAKTTGSN